MKIGRKERILLGAIFAVFAVLPVFPYLLSGCEIQFGYDYSQFEIVAERSGRNIIFNGEEYFSVADVTWHRFGTEEILGIVDGYEDTHPELIRAVRHDPDHEFLLLMQGRDFRRIFSRTHTEIVPGEAATAILLGHHAEHKISNPRDIEIFLLLENLSGEEFLFRNRGSAAFSEVISVAYYGMPISARDIGRIAKIDGAWIYVPEGSREHVGNEIFHVGFIIADDEIAAELSRIAYENNTNPELKPVFHCADFCRSARSKNRRDLAGRKVFCDAAMRQKDRKETQVWARDWYNIRAPGGS